MSEQSIKPEIEELTLDESELLDEILDDFGESRRRFIGHSGTAALTGLVLEFVAKRNAFGGDVSNGLSERPPADENAIDVTFRVNGIEKNLTLDSRMTLLDALRERLALTGTKKGCDHGQCGACTVLIDGRRVLSCLTLTAQCEGRDVTTIEGLAKGSDLHPMQAAFVKHDSFQCGFCTSGQICSAVALVQEAKNGDLSYVSTDFRQKPHSLELADDELRERMSGNICRCGAYPNILNAVREVHLGRPTDPELPQMTSNGGAA